MRLPDKLTDAQHAAIVAFLRIAAMCGGEIEQAERKAKDAGLLGNGAASLAGHNGAALFPKDATDANKP